MKKQTIKELQARIEALEDRIRVLEGRLVIQWVYTTPPQPPVFTIPAIPDPPVFPIIVPYCQPAYPVVGPGYTITTTC